MQDGVVKDGKILSDERFYLQATVTLAAHELAVGTTHLPFHPRFRTTPTKQRMVESTLAHVPNTGNYILAGDFNTTPRTKGAVTFRKRGLKHAGPALAQPTWTTKPFRIGPWAYEALKWRLDYILYKGDIVPSASRIVRTELSDHLPVVVEFELKK